MIPTHENDLERELGSRLVELVHSPSPPSSVDVDMARRHGGRLRRRKRVAVAGVTAAVGAALLSMSTVGPLANGTGDVTAAAAVGKDPLVTKGDFGWLPANLTTLSYVGGSDGATTRASGKGDSFPIVWLTVYDSGVVPKAGTSPGDGPLHLEPGPRVGGSPGSWVVGSAGVAGSGSLTLRWKTAGGRWADVAEQGLPAGDRQDMVERIAETSTVTDRAVPLPFFISDLPAASQFRSGYYSVPGALPKDGAWDVAFSYGPKGTDSYVLWRIRASGATPVVPDRTLGETCVTQGGLDLCVSGKGGTLSAFGGAKGLISKITLLGPDKRNWTTSVVR